jgi:hypothetical protein
MVSDDAASRAVWLESGGALAGLKRGALESSQAASAQRAERASHAS